MTDQRPAEFDFRLFLFAFRRRFWVFLLCVIVVPGAAVGISYLQEKEYTAEASLLFRDPQFDQKLFGSSTVQGSTDPARAAATNVELVSLDKVAALTAEKIGAGFSGDEITELTEVKSEGQSDVVSIEATALRPELAARVANTFAKEYIGFRRDADRAKIRAAQKPIRAELKDLSKRERARPTGIGLTQRLDELRVLGSLQTGNAELVEPAQVPTDPSWPDPVLNGALGLVLGALLGIGLVLLVDRLDRRLRDPKEVELAFERPVLAALPESPAIKNADRALQEVPEAEREAFRMLRANLRYFSVSREISSVLITSAGSGDGKSTVAWGLAVASATAGSRTLLVEADLRHPTFSSRYSMRARRGLTSVLTGEHSREDATIRVPLPSGSAESHHAMDVLLAGAVPPNPTDLIESEQMAAFLKDAERDYDLVVIDTPPTAVVSDAIPLLTMVGGVLVVSRLGKTTRDSLRHLRRQLENVNAPVLGLVTNSIDRGPGYGYGYAYGYGYGYGGREAAEARKPSRSAAAQSEPVLEEGPPRQTPVGGDGAGAAPERRTVLPREQTNGSAEATRPARGPGALAAQRATARPEVRNGSGVTAPERPRPTSPSQAPSANEAPPAQRSLRRRIRNFIR